jgi:hypothetical protein
MHWLSSPRVRLGLIVNGLYFLSLFSPSPSYTRAKLYARAYESPAGRLRSKGSPGYAPLLPQTGPLKAETRYLYDSQQLEVYLTREIVLVRRRDHTLLLSPTYAMSRLPYSKQTLPVLLHFSSFSHEQLFDRDSSFVITADGVELWRYGRRGPGDMTPSNAKGLYTAALDDNDQVAETLGHEIPYDLFVQLVSAQNVTFELGPDTIELTQGQLDVLRDMQFFPSQTLPAKPGADYLPYSRPKRHD